MVDMKVINNFLKNKKIFKDIQNTLLGGGNGLPYYYQDHTADPEDKSDYFFCHMLYYDNQQKSSYFNKILMPILGNLNFNYLHRAKVNCYTKKHKHIKTVMHTDMAQKHTVALFSVNTNNGYTLFENGEKVVSVENQLVLFDGSIKHCSVAQTDENLRVNININLS